MIEFSGLEIREIIDALGLKEEEVVEKIEDAYGKKIIERAKIVDTYWRKAYEKEIVEPLLVIIGGMPGVGKSTLSAKIAKTLGINIVMGGDAFRGILREFIKKEEEPAFFVSVYKAWQEFGEYSKENVIKGFEAQAKIMNKAVERLIVDRGIRDGESMVVDFLHFLPSLWMKETLEHPSVIPLVLYVEDKERWKEFIKYRVRKTHLKGGWERLVKALESYEIMRDYQLEVARKYDVPAFATDDWEKLWEDVMDYITARIQKIIEIKRWDKEHPMIAKIKKERKESS